MTHKPYKINATNKRIISRAVRGLYYKTYIKKSVSMDIVNEKDLIRYYFFDKVGKKKWNGVVFLFYKDTVEIRVRGLFSFMYSDMWYITTLKKHRKLFPNKRYEFNEIIKLIRI